MSRNEDSNTLPPTLASNYDIVKTSPTSEISSTIDLTIYTRTVTTKATNGEISLRYTPREPLNINNTID